MPSPDTGNRGRGRPKGAKGKRNQLGEDIARALLDKNQKLPQQLLSSESDKVRSATYQFLFEQAYGRARARIDLDVSGQLKVDTVIETLRQAARIARGEKP